MGSISSTTTHTVCFPPQAVTTPTAHIHTRTHMPAHTAKSVRYSPKAHSTCQDAGSCTQDKMHTQTTAERPRKQSSGSTATACLKAALVCRCCYRLSSQQRSSLPGRRKIQQAKQAHNTTACMLSDNYRTHRSSGTTVRARQLLCTLSAQLYLP
jgi:hypothetical protein